MALDFTVAIPVYNGAERISAVLDHLRAQAETEAIRWEVLVVDNNSSDHLYAVIQSYQAHWRDDVPLRYCFEPRQGLAYTRARAVAEADGHWVGFLDDDNWPDSSWVAAALRFGQTHPRAGAFGGPIDGDFEAEVPAGFNQIKTFLVIRRYGDQPRRFQPERLRLPAGAGLVVNTTAWHESVPSQFRCIGGGGDDYEISLWMHRQGWEIWYCPEMVIRHRIPAWRMQLDYLTKIAYRYGCCTSELLMIITPVWQRPWVLLRSLMGNLKRLVEIRLRQWRQASNDESPDKWAIACNTAFFWGNVVSPLLLMWRLPGRLWRKWRSPHACVASLSPPSRSWSSPSRPSSSG